MDVSQPSEPATSAGDGESLGRPDARRAVTALYQAQALGLIRLAVVMLGDRAAAEDVVQDAFCGLYRRWHALSDTDNALSYVRSSVINGCRSALRRRGRLVGVA
jgi:DNA-directed RNA polymerase specialized sigma24 family protein